MSEQPQPAGCKDDAGKDRWDLLPWREMTAVVKVLTGGAQKPGYSDNGWQAVVSWPGGVGRYFAAACRHLTTWFFARRKDPEFGQSHLAHAICCLLFMMWAEHEGQLPALTAPELQAPSEGPQP